MKMKHCPTHKDNQFTSNRLIDLNGKKRTNKYAKKGIFFTPSREAIPSKPINLYNHGCPILKWSIDAEKVARTRFQIFSTGDAFSVISQDIEIIGAHINIHVGIEHARYSPLVLLQEALQLCRATYEHGARHITISLPESFHPLATSTDFNSLLLSLFKASGANKVYYYDKNYIGKLDETNLFAVIPLSKAPQDIAAQLSLDEQIMHVTRERHFMHAWSKFNPDNLDALASLCDNKSLLEIKIPEIKVQPHVLLCCSANKPLAEKIAASFRMRGEMVSLYHIDGEGEQATIPSDATLCGAVVTIVQSTRPNPDCIETTHDYQKNGASSYFFEALTIARQARLRGAQTINLINPYQFSARSDKAEDNFKGKTGAYVQQNGLLMEAAGVNQVITAECHDNHTMSGAYTGKQIKGTAVKAISILSTRLAKEWAACTDSSRKGQIRLVAPDAGAAKRTQELTELLQAILGNALCQSRVLGEKQRDSHKDDSALISSLNSGNIGINPEDKYLITDDETATGTTLCQAVENLTQNGAKDIAVVVVHNNMPLDWLLRQLCLARFFYLGVNDLHFSDTQEMGTLAASYEHLITHYAQHAKLLAIDVEAQVFAWFKKNMGETVSGKSDEFTQQEFNRFKSLFNQFESRIRVHSLANELANKVITKPYNSVVHAADSSGFYTGNSNVLLFSQTQKMENVDKSTAEGYSLKI
jgi:phosphoribosylpyrophosphate synthetase